MADKRDFSKKQVIAQVKNERLIVKKHLQIVEAASKLFSKKGYHATTLREISAESGINLSYLYKYISSKDDILYLFYTHLYRQWVHVYEEFSRSKDENPVDQLKKLLRSILEVVYKLNDQILTMYTESRHMQIESLRAVLSEESRMIEIMEELIIQGVNQGIFKTQDAFLTANIVQYLIVIYPLRGWNFRDRYTFDQFVDLVTDFVLNALGVREADK